MYSLPAYGKMIADKARIEAYVSALRKVVRTGSVVIDLGSGPGLFALIACQLGARRVFAIEPDNVIQVGREAAREHGFSDRIEFFQELSTKVTLPERVDVVVSDLRGVLPWYAHHIASIADARTRFLAPSGVLIPQSDRLWAAVVEFPEKYDEIVTPWNGNDTGVSLNFGRRLAVNLWSKVRVKPENLLTESVNWRRLDYYDITETDFCENISLTAMREGIAHGLAVWFDAELCDGIGFSNAPGAEQLIYGNAFFPFEVAVDLARGDSVDVRLEGRLIGDDYVWRWDTTVSSSTGQACSFKQSTLLGVPFSTSELRRLANTEI